MNIFYFSLRFLFEFIAIFIFLYLIVETLVIFIPLESQYDIDARRFFISLAILALVLPLTLAKLAENFSTKEGLDDE